MPVTAATVRGLAWFCIGYFVVLNSAYLVLLALAAGNAVADRSRVRFAGLPEIFASPLAPPISLIVPVCNMADLIVGSTRGLLGLRYPEFEVIVVDDGSTDATFGRLQAEFGLVEVDKVIRDELTTVGRVISVHAPRDGSNLLVIRKQSAGRPADAVNVGVNAAKYPLVCRVDAGTYLDADALLTVAKPFIEDPARVVAVGATIRVANGSEIRGGRVTRPRVAGGWLLPIQAAEYLRSFLLGRAGWSQIGGMLFISGAFGDLPAGHLRAGRRVHSGRRRRRPRHDHPHPPAAARRTAALPHRLRPGAVLLDGGAAHLPAARPAARPLVPDPRRGPVGAPGDDLQPRLRHGSACSSCPST